MGGRGLIAPAALTVTALLISAGSAGSDGAPSRAASQAAPETVSSAAAPPTPQPLSPVPYRLDAEGCRYVRTRLPAPNGFPNLEPAGSNGHRAIAGTASLGLHSVPVLWHDGRVTRLATPGGRNGHAVDVNRSGVVERRKTATGP